MEKEATLYGNKINTVEKGEILIESPNWSFKKWTVEQMEKYTMFMDWKNQYCQNEYITESNIQIQCNPYQATNGNFHRTRTNNFTICMEIQKKQKKKTKKKNLEQPK